MELGDLDLYAELGVTSDALAQNIKAAYRKLALKYHPDKNPSQSAADKFQRLASIYATLSNAELREKYDGLRGKHSSADVRRFREELWRREKSRLPRTDAHKIEALRKEGLALRKRFQTSATSGYVSYRAIKVPVVVEKSFKRVCVSWKPREGVEFDEATLRQIMLKFGDVDSVAFDKSDGKYFKGLVTFAQHESAVKAIRHDYRSASYWDGTPVRKVASLMRGCTRAPDEHAQAVLRSAGSFHPFG